jgi:hypothetical protein
MKAQKVVPKKIVIRKYGFPLKNASNRIIFLCFGEKGWRNFLRI